MSILIVKNLDKELGEQKSLVLSGLNFSIDKGEFVSLVGKSGSGKSTLLYVLSTLDVPTRGEVRYFNRNLTDFSAPDLHRLRNQQIGFVFQFHYLLPELTALENVLMPTRKFGQYDQKKKFAKELLDKMDLSDKFNHLPRELSGGQAQRVAIARALIMNPSFLFADEPTGALDSVNSKKVLEIFKEINRDFQTTIVFVTHDIDMANAAQRQIRLVDGRITSEN